MRSLVEEGLRRCLDAECPATGYRLPDLSVGEAEAANPLESLSWYDSTKRSTAPDTNVLVYAHRLIGEPEDFFEVLDDFVTRPRVRGPIVHDARVAAARSTMIRAKSTP